MIFYTFSPRDSEIVRTPLKINGNIVGRRPRNNDILIFRARKWFFFLYRSFLQVLSRVIIILHQEYK